MATKREMTADEAALVGKWGVFRTSWANNLALGEIVKFTEQRAYVKGRHSPAPRERCTLLAAFETEADAGRAAQAYERAFRAGNLEVDRAAAALATAKAVRLAGAETAAVVGSLPLPPA